ncbi:MAG: SDR family oxidoreductase [Saprospiraceae bacterium]
MKNKPNILAYCAANKTSAEEFANDLSKAGISFTHFACEDAKSSLCKELLKAKGSIYLMISDNFLKSSHCMVDALELLSKGLQGDRIQAIITESMVPGGESSQLVAQPTQFSRISDLINYMNFWQERYLKLRKQKEDVEKGEMDAFEKELKRVRIISAEIGEFLRMLRDTEYWTMEQLKEDHYALFFNRIGKQDLIIPFQKESIQKETAPKLQTAKEEKENTTPSVLDESTITDPEEIEAIRLTKLEKEQQKTQQEFSDIFNDDSSNEENIESENDDLAIANNTFENWEDINKDGKPDNELTHKMKNRFFERIDELVDNNEEIIAAKELRQFLQVNNKSAQAHHYLSLIETSNENFEEARRHGELAVELKPDSSQYHLALGRILFHHFSDSPKLAERSFVNAVQLNPANMEAHYDYAMLLHEVLEKSKKAINHLELTLAIRPDHPFANYDLALIYYAMKKREKAAMYYERAFNINPELRTPDNDIAFWYESYLQPDENEDPETDSNFSLGDVVLENDFDDLAKDETEEIDTQDELDEELVELLLEKEEIQEALINNKTTQQLEENEMDTALNRKSQTKQSTDIKTIMITGATSGIGKASAKLFAEAGHRLILTGRREGRLNELKKELQGEYGNDITVLDFDVRYLSVAKKSFAQLSEDWENIDLLVNNAGLAKGLDPIHEGDVKHWEIMLDTNVKGLLFMTRIVSPGMVERGSGQIINVCSSAGHEVYPKGAVYCATKHAVDALTKGMRLDLHQHGIRVGQVSPGHVEETEFAVVRFDGDKEKAKIYDDFQPLKSSDVADAIFYMANAPKHVTIQDIVMMGTQQASSVFIDRSGR